MNLLTQNRKLKSTSKELGLRVFNFGIPAYKSASGKLTCPFADECVKFCYAKKGAYIWSNVQPAFEKRYQLTITDKFVTAMTKEIITANGNLYQLIRVIRETRLKNPNTEDLKKYFYCDTVLRKQGMLYFCRIIKEIEYEEINQ